MTKSTVQIHEDAAALAWQTLAPMLDDSLALALVQSGLMECVNAETLDWLSQVVAEFPWLDALAFATIVSSCVDPANALTHAGNVHRFFCWAIPAHSPDLASLNPEETLVACFADRSASLDDRVFVSYCALLLQTRAYLNTLPPEKNARLRKYRLPDFRRATHYVVGLRDERR
jgi:hypothetical protein